MHSDDSNYVFTTEGHILFLDKQHMRPTTPARKRARKVMNHQCPAYDPFVSTKTRRRPYHNSNPNSNLGLSSFGLVQGVRSRPDVEYARYLVNLAPTAADEQHWSPDGWCEKPKIEPYVSHPTTSYNPLLDTGVLLTLLGDLLSPSSSFWRRAAVRFLKI